MNKFLLALPVVLALLGTGCTNSDTASVSTKQDGVNQIFEQKKQCEPYYAAYKKEKDDLIRSAYSTVTVSGCFSQKYNSCIGVSEVSDSKVDDTVWNEWEVKDLLTGEVISSVKDQVFGKGNEDDNAWYAERQYKLSKDIIGVNCSDGQQLYPIR